MNRRGEDADAPEGTRGAPAAVGLGSNLGDRASNLAVGVRGLADLLEDLRCSRVYETEPMGVGGGHPRYLNLCCVGRSSAGPRGLLEALLGIERAAGRRRPEGAADAGPRPRTLDLDLLLFGDRVVREPGLRVPHPRMRRRPFVLVPLADVAGDWRDPVTGRTVAELAERVDASGVRPYGGDLPSDLEERIEA